MTRRWAEAASGPGRGSQSPGFIGNAPSCPGSGLVISMQVNSHLPTQIERKSFFSVFRNPNIFYEHSVWHDFPGNRRNVLAHAEGF